MLYLTKYHGPVSWTVFDSHCVHAPPLTSNTWRGIASIGNGLGHSDTAGTRAIRPTIQFQVADDSVTSGQQYSLRTSQQCSMSFEMVVAASSQAAVVAAAAPAGTAEAFNQAEFFAMAADTPAA